MPAPLLDMETPDAKIPRESAKVSDLPEILCTRHIMRSNDHGYADEADAYGGGVSTACGPLPALPEGLLEWAGPMTLGGVQD